PRILPENQHPAGGEHAAVAQDHADVRAINLRGRLTADLASARQPFQPRIGPNARSTCSPSRSASHEPVPTIRLIGSGLLNVPFRWTLTITTRPSSRPMPAHPSFHRPAGHA